MKMINSNQPLLRLPAPILYLFQHIQALKISFRQLSISPITTFMTFAVIGITLALPTGLFILLKNAQGITQNLNNTAQITLYLKHNIKQKQIDNLRKVIKSNQNVKTINYISPSEGLKQFQHDSEFNDALNTLKENPLPGVIIVKPKKAIGTILQIEQLSSILKKLPFVDNIQMDTQWLQRLNAILILIHNIIYSIVILFALGVLLIIGNTISLITQNYKDEITIIKLLGGSNRFIRRPFLYSGIIYGITGSITAWILADSAMFFLKPSIKHLTNLYNSQISIQSLDLTYSLILLFGGGILGYIGSWLAVRRHIKPLDDF